jgi:hypothetical protein
MDAVEALLPYRNATNIFPQISKKISYLLINLRTYITYNENIVSFNVLQWRLVAQIDGGANMRQWFILTLLYYNNNNNNNNNNSMQ